MLKDELQPETGSRDLILSETDVTHDITVTEHQISNLEIEYKQKRQRLEQQKSVLVTKDLLQMSSVRKSHVPCPYHGSADH